MTKAKFFFLLFVSWLIVMGWYGLAKLSRSSDTKVPDDIEVDWEAIERMNQPGKGSSRPSSSATGQPIKRFEPMNRAEAAQEFKTFSEKAKAIEDVAQELGKNSEEPPQKGEDEKKSP